MRTPFGDAARKQFMVLTVAWPKRPGGSMPFRNGAAAEALLDGQTTTRRGKLVQERAAVAHLIHRYAESYVVIRAQRMMGLTFRDQRIPTREEFTEAVDREHLAAIKLTPAGQP